MPIRVICPCGQKIDAAERFAGRSVKCPTCGAALTIPNPTADAGANMGTMEVLDMSEDSPQEKSALTLEPLENSGASARSGMAGLQPTMENSGALPATGATTSAYAPPTRVVEEEDDSISAKTVVGYVAFVALCLTTLVGVVVTVLFWLPSQEQLVASSQDAPESSVQADSDGGLTNASGTGTNASTTTGRVSEPEGTGATASSATSPAGNSSSGPDKLRNIFGYDKEKRTQLSEYLQLKGHSRGHIGVLNLKILGRLNGVCKNFDLKPDDNNYVVFPEKAFPEYRERFDQGKLFEDEKLAQELPDLLQDMKKDYEGNKLNEADRHLAFIVFSAFLLEEF
ncbi:MAG: hypothetical protein AAF394_11530 [Planctomycetota bacterium]